MFKNKIILIDENWDYITSYNSRFKPFVDEFIYIDQHKTYYKVLVVIHSLKHRAKSTTIIVKKWEFFKKN